jgi:hypothetical protein
LESGWRQLKNQPEQLFSSTSFCRDFIHLPGSPRAPPVEKDEHESGKNETLPYCFTVRAIRQADLMLVEDFR